MSRHAFRDFDEFADSIEGIAGRFVPTKRSSADWWVEAVPAGRLSLQQVQIGGAATFAGDGQLGCVTVGMPMTHPLRIHIDGGRLDEGSFLFLKPQQPFTFASGDATRWAGITVPIGHRLLEPEVADAAHESGTARSRAPLPHVVGLREVAARLCAADESISITNPVSASATEQEIVVAVSRMLEHSTRIREMQHGRFYHSRQRVIGRTLELIEASDGQPLHIADLCEATEVSERTLRNIFNDYFGVTPIRLIKLRQLREIRIALAATDPEHDTVAQVAERFGIWDFSLFARNYRRLFGENPSQTLRLPPGRLGASDNLSWLDCAMRIFIEEARPAPPLVEIAEGPFAVAPAVMGARLTSSRA